MNTLAIKIKDKARITDEELHREIDNRIDKATILEILFKAGYWWNKDRQCYEVRG